MNNNGKSAFVTRGGTSVRIKRAGAGGRGYRLILKNPGFTLGTEVLTGDQLIALADLIYEFEEVER